MPPKDSIWRDLILILVFCILSVTTFVLFHRLNLLYYIALIYWCVLAGIWGIPLVRVGMTELREARRRGERIHWTQNASIAQGIMFLLPPLCELYRRLISKPIPELGAGHTGWQLIFDIIDIIIMSVLLVFWLFFEVGLTIGFIRRHLINANPYTHYLESLTTEDAPYEEQAPAQHKAEISE